VIRAGSRCAGPPRGARARARWRTPGSRASAPPAGGRYRADSIIRAHDRRARAHRRAQLVGRGLGGEHEQMDELVELRPRREVRHVGLAAREELDHRLARIAAPLSRLLQLLHRRSLAHDEHLRGLRRLLPPEPIHLDPHPHAHRSIHTRPAATDRRAPGSPRAPHPSARRRPTPSYRAPAPPALPGSPARSPPPAPTPAAPHARSARARVQRMRSRRASGVMVLLPARAEGWARRRDEAEVRSRREPFASSTGP
jgi:hypothetical protein